MHRWTRPTDHSHDSDDAVNAQALPGQTQHQGMQLLRAELVMSVDPCRWPDELAFVEPTSCQPDADAVVHENLHAIGPAVGKQIGVVGMRCAEYLDYSAKCCIRARSHVQWLYRQPGAVDANHLSTDEDQQANSLAADMGQVTVMTSPALRTSTLISRAGDSAGFVRSGSAMKDGTQGPATSAAVALVSIDCLDWDDPLSHRCSTLAFMPLALATAAIDAPGALHAASNSALVSAEYERLVRRTAYLGVSESLSIVSTIV